MIRYKSMCTGWHIQYIPSILHFSMQIQCIKLSLHRAMVKGNKRRRKKIAKWIKITSNLWEARGPSGWKHVWDYIIWILVMENGKEVTKTFEWNIKLSFTTIFPFIFRCCFAYFRVLIFFFSFFLCFFAISLHRTVWHLLPFLSSSSCSNRISSEISSCHFVWFFSNCFPTKNTSLY